MSNRHGDKTIEKLTDYLTSREGEVYLTDLEEEILKMARMAHDLNQAGRFPSYKILRMMCHHFDCSESKARMAMADAQAIFGAVNIHKKEYHAQLHLDEIIADIARARDAGDIASLLKLHEIKVKIIAMLPSLNDGRLLPPTEINYYILKADAAPTQLNKGKALELASQYLANRNIVDAELVEDGK